MKVGDWVLDRHENLGRVKRLDIPHDHKGKAVEVSWHAFVSNWEVPHPFVDKKYLTVVTKEVADILIAVKP